MNEHHHDDRLCPGCAAEIVSERALADDLADVLDGLGKTTETVERNEVKRVLARYREARQR